MKYYIENELYDEDKTKLNKLNIGFINKKNKLIWFSLKTIKVE